MQRLPCACAELRKAARVVTRYYDLALRPSGLEATQFTLLQALQFAPGITQKRMAELLGMDSTTLTRTLAPLRRRGWIRSSPGADRRELRHSLTAAGQREYERALPYWENAQKKLKRALGAGEMDRLLDAAARVGEVIASAPMVL